MKRTRLPLQSRTKNEKQVLMDLKNYYFLTNDGRFLYKHSRPGVPKHKVGTQAGRIQKKGYRELAVNGVRILEHRLVWLWKHGVYPKGQLDHKDRCRTNNHIDNLHEANQLINGKNLTIKSNNTSGINGVRQEGFYKNGDEKWSAKIKVNYKTIFLGNYRNKQSAIEARKEANIKYGFSLKHGEKL